MSICYVEQDYDGSWLDHNCYLAAEGFVAKDYDVRGFTYNQLYKGVIRLAVDIPIVGRTESVLMALNQLGKKPPRDPEYPAVMKRGFMDREPKETTIEALKRLLGTPMFMNDVFIRPVEHNLFKGRKISKFKDLLPIDHLPDSTKIWQVQDINFLSEYRVFFFKDEMVGMKHYKGNPLVFPNPATVKKLVIRAKSAGKVAFSMDIGIAFFEERPEMVSMPTLLIKCNDAFDLESYGLPSKPYSDMLEYRFRQMANR